MLVLLQKSPQWFNRHGVSIDVVITCFYRVLQWFPICDPVSGGCTLCKNRGSLWLTALWLVSLAAILMAAGAAEAALQCYDCHGTRANGDNRPLDAPYRNVTTGGFQGTHRNHLSVNAGAAGCAPCHPGSTSYNSAHRDGTITLSRNINSSHVAARYLNQTSAFSRWSTSFPQSASPNPGNCSNVNCHFETATPRWGSASLSAPSGCNSCHGAPPQDGSHAQHFNAFTSSAGRTFQHICVKCHNGNPSFGHATSAGRRGLRISFTDPANNAGIYTGDVSYPNYLPSNMPSRSGACNTLYCHSNAAPFDKANVYKSPNWGGAALVCTSCHDGSGPLTSLSGRHGKHTDNASYAFACERCHNGTVTGNGTIGDKSLHINFVKDVGFKEGGDYDRGGARECSNTYCHSDARGGAPNVAVKWSDTAPMQCYSCHRGTINDQVGGIYMNMTSNGHKLLVGPQWIRKYPCTYCHNATVAPVTVAAGKPPVDGTINKSRHVDGVKNVVMDPFWSIDFMPFPAYSSVSGGRKCYNVYCHSDGTRKPEYVKPFGWNEGRTRCNTCHGHPTGTCSALGCHDGLLHEDPAHPENTKVWPVITGWPVGEEWKAAVPMYPNQGRNMPRANSHPRHIESNFTCDKCHNKTINISNGTCTGAQCHVAGQSLPAGNMGTLSHLDGTYHVNKRKDVNLKDGGSYDDNNKNCTNTKCHTGPAPVWGDSVNGSIICLSCHGTTDPDVDAFQFINESTQARINTVEWASSGHGRYSSAGRYPGSGNPAANFPSNPCWYCHDNKVLHNDQKNLFRLRQHSQFAERFEKECVYCHMERTGDAGECKACHVAQAESLAPQATAAGIVFRKKDNSRETRYTGHTYVADCINGAGSEAGTCHDSDSGTFAGGAHKGHSVNAGLWNAAQKADIKNQYLMMGVCLKCHDEDSGDKCTQCHTPPATNLLKYSIGFDPGTGFIKPKKARATSAHFGYKHYRAFQDSGGWQFMDGKWKAVGSWKGGKFCWDCHDPHGDGNIYMIQSKVATSTDGVFGIPQTRADVDFKSTKGIGPGGYARNDSKDLVDGKFTGICNVCHTPGSKHFTSTSGDSHSGGRRCTNCHEHRFSDSHADNQSCSECHQSKPVPRHSAFGQPRDCTKCHNGVIGKRMNIMQQMNGTSHHVQGVAVNNKHCYACHWESTPEGLIDVRYHEGYNYKTYTSVKNAKVDLVVWNPGNRPAYYNTTTAVQFMANNIGTANERAEVTRLTGVCISCHSDRNNNNRDIFGDCKTPRQYAWDGQSIDARYSQSGTTPWGKYNSTTYPNVAKKDLVTKAFSAHGNAVANQGGWDPASGLDATIPNTRNGRQNVQCFDCHSSHGSTVAGVTSSYVTFNGSRNGGNLKETRAGQGGYAMDYTASANPVANAVNAYNAGAGQCFDCHNNASAGTTPWGYFSTYSARAPIMGYKDTPRFGAGTKGSTSRYAYRSDKKDIVSGHLVPRQANFLNYSAKGKINGLCTPCHDPHGVSPSLGGNQRYAVPMLKGTWMTSPYKEDKPAPNPFGPNATANSWGKASISPPEGWNTPTGVSPVVGYNVDRTTFGESTRISEDATKFAGLCMRCHPKGNLTDGTPNNTAWRSVDRVHESVKGWGDTGKATEHAYTCSKCHTPHNSGLPRLLATDCLNYKHRGEKASGGQPWTADKQATASGESGRAHTYASQHRGYPVGNQFGSSASHEATDSCHAGALGNTGTTWPDNNRWNNVTTW